MAKEACVKCLPAHVSPSRMSPGLGYGDARDKDQNDINMLLPFNKAVSFSVFSLIILEDWIL